MDKLKQAARNSDSHDAAEEIRTIYEQDCESLRYHDGVKWSRFQTVTLIEGGALVAAFGDVFNFSPLGRLCLVFAASVLIALIYLLLYVDDNNAGGHLSRIRRFENSVDRPYPKGNTRPLANIRTSRHIMAVVLVCNASVIGLLAWRALGW